MILFDFNIFLVFRINLMKLVINTLIIFRHTRANFFFLENVELNQITCIKICDSILKDGA